MKLCGKSTRNIEYSEVHEKLQELRSQVAILLRMNGKSGKSDDSPKGNPLNEVVSFSRCSSDGMLLAVVAARGGSAQRVE